LKGLNEMITLINCYIERRDERIKNYIELFKEFGVIEVIYDENFSPLPGSKVYIISGSEKYVSQNDFNPELLKFIKESETPLMGICYGHQLIARAFDAEVFMGEGMIKKKEYIRVLKDEDIFEGLPKVFSADESHKDHVKETEEFKKNFEVIASSDSCYVEAIKHKKKPIFGFQFHIERSGDIGKIIARNFFRIIGEKYE